GLNGLPVELLHRVAWTAHVRAMPQPLRRDAADVRAGASVHPLRALDQRDALAEPAHRRSDCLTGLTEAEHKQVDMPSVVSHPVAPSLHQFGVAASARFLARSGPTAFWSSESAPIRAYWSRSCSTAHVRAPNGGQERERFLHLANVGTCLRNGAAK